MAVASWITCRKVAIVHRQQRRPYYPGGNECLVSRKEPSRGLYQTRQANAIHKIAPAGGPSREIGTPGIRSDRTSNGNNVPQASLPHGQPALALGPANGT